MGKDNKMSLAERFKARRIELGLTQKNVAESINMSQQSLQRIESGQILNPRRIVDLAKVLECEPDWLLFGKNDPNKEKSNVEPGPEIHGFYPLIDWVQAGNWSEINEIHPAEAEYFPCPIKCSDSTFLLKVRGQSMNPVFNDNDLIFIDPEVEAINGKYVVARLDDENEATFKQLIVEGGQKFLKAINPQWPTPIMPINGNCTIVGVVIFAGKWFL